MREFYFKFSFISLLLVGMAFGGFAQNQNYLEFDGSNDYVYRNDNSDLDKLNNASEYTIEAWIYISSWKDYQRVVSRYTHWQMYLRLNGQLAFRVNDGGTWKINYSSNYSVSTGSWQHIAVIRSSGKIHFYVNGANVDAGSYPGYVLPGPSTNDHLYIGQDGSGGNDFDGYIDEVRLSSTAISLANLHSNVYDNQYVDDPTYTAALFHFNEGTGTSTLDASKNINATLYNSPTWRAWNYVSTAHLPLAYEWLGATIDWGTGSNWNSSSVPTTSNDIIIPSGTSNDPTIGGSTNALANNLKLLSGATLTLASGSTLDILETFTNNGTFVDNGSVSFKGSSAQTIPAATFNNVKIDNANGVTLGGAVTIKGTLTLSSGIITSTSTNLLTFASTANAVSGGSNTAYVDGPVAKIGSTDFVFPCGDGGKYARIGISNLSGSETFTAEYVQASPANNTSLASPLARVSDKEYWNLERTGSVTADVTFYWEDSQWSGIGDFDDLRLAHWNSTSSEWESVSGTYSHSGSVSLSTPNAGSLSVTGVNSFSPFAPGTTNNTTNTLPIELLSFTAVNTLNAISLEWKTASELNNHGFEIQRSEDNTNWTTIGFVQGAGNSNQILEYSYIDNAPKVYNYYRLKQLDFDANYYFSKVVYVKLIQDLSLNIFPNPADNYVSINQLDLLNASQIMLYDAAGRLVQKIDLNTLKLDVSNIDKGYYYIVITKENGSISTGKFLKQ